MTLDAVVVGLGRIGAGFQRDPLRHGAVTHAGAYAAHDEFTLVAGVDPDGDQRAAFEADFGVPTYATYDDLIGHHRPDVVSIAVPPAMHGAAVWAALEGGATRVICEKPFTPSRREAEALVAAAGDGAARIGVNYTRRFDPLHRDVLGWFAEARPCGGTGRYTAGIRNTASHWFASLLAAGFDIVSVLARPSVDGDDPSPTVVLETCDGAHVYLEGHDVADHLLFEFDLVADDRRVQLLDSGARAIRFERRPSPMFSGYSELRPIDEHLPAGLESPMLPVVDDAVRSIAEGRPMACSAADALVVHRIIEAALSSLQTGSWVTL